MEHDGFARRKKMLKALKKKIGQETAMEPKISIVQHEIGELSSSVSQLHGIMKGLESRLFSLQGKEKRFIDSTSEGMEKNKSQMKKSFRKSLLVSAHAEGKLKGIEHKIDSLRKETALLMETHQDIRKLGHNMASKIRGLRAEIGALQANSHALRKVESRLSALENNRMSFEKKGRIKGRGAKERDIKAFEGMMKLKDKIDRMEMRLFEGRHAKAGRKAKKRHKKTTVNVPEIKKDVQQEIGKKETQPQVQAQEAKQEIKVEKKTEEIQPVLIHAEQQEAVKSTADEGVKLKLKEEYSKYIEETSKPKKGLSLIASRIFRGKDDHLAILKGLAFRELRNILLMADKKLASVYVAHLTRSFLELCLGAGKATTYSEIVDAVRSRQGISDEMKASVERFFGIMNAKEYTDTVMESDIQYVVKEAEAIIRKFNIQ